MPHSGTPLLSEVLKASGLSLEGMQVRDQASWVRLIRGAVARFAPA